MQARKPSSTSDAASQRGKRPEQCERDLRLRLAVASRRSPLRGMLSQYSRTSAKVCSTSEKRCGGPLRCCLDGSVGSLAWTIVAGLARLIWCRG
jgi:hypothetical protein